MNKILYLSLLLLAVCACDCGDNSPTTYDSAELTGIWKLVQKATEGRIISQNTGLYPTIAFDQGNSYIKTEGEQSSSGTYSLSGHELTMLSSEQDTLTATITQLNAATLALQLIYDHDNDGDEESVRETYISF